MVLILKKFTAIDGKYSIPYEQAAGMMTAAKTRGYGDCNGGNRRYSNDGDRDGRGRT